MSRKNHSRFDSEYIWDRDIYEDIILEFANTDKITYIKSSPFWLVLIYYKNKTIIGSGITRLFAIEDVYKQIKEKNNGSKSKI